MDRDIQNRKINIDRQRFLSRLSKKFGELCSTNNKVWDYISISISLRNTRCVHFGWVKMRKVHQISNVECGMNCSWSTS